MGALSDRIGRAVPIVVGSLCYGLGILAVGAAPSVAVAAVAMVSIGVLGALVSPTTMALVTDLAAEDERGLAMAGFNLAGSLGFLGGFRRRDRRRIVRLRSRLLVVGASKSRSRSSRHPSSSVFDRHEWIDHRQRQGRSLRVM